MNRFSLILATILLALSAGAANALSIADKSEVERAESYLNAVSTLKAHFLQVAPDGSSVEGTAYLSRPGHLRLDYDPPSPIQIYADSRHLIYFDRKLEQTSYVDIEDSPAGVLVLPKVALDGAALKTLAVTRQPGIVNIAVTKRSDPGQGSITLTFSLQPYQLRQWKVLDAQGQVTTVTLYDAQSGVALDKSLFDFRDPGFYKN